MLLGSRSFKGNVLGKHMQLQGITPAHFAAWVRLWNEHTARLFAPEVAHGLQAAAHGWPAISSEGILGAARLCHAAPRRPCPRGLSASRPFASHGVGNRPLLTFNKPAPQAQAFVLRPLPPGVKKKCHADGDQRDRPPDAKQFAQADADEPQVGQQKKYAQNNQHDGCDVALHLHSLFFELIGSHYGAGPPRIRDAARQELPPPQRRQKLAQTVVVDFVHQRQQTAQLVVRKASRANQFR